MPDCPPNFISRLKLAPSPRSCTSPVPSFQFLRKRVESPSFRTRKTISPSSRFYPPSPQNRPLLIMRKQKQLIPFKGFDAMAIYDLFPLRRNESNEEAEEVLSQRRGLYNCLQSKWTKSRIMQTLKKRRNQLIAPSLQFNRTEVHLLRRQRFNESFGKLTRALKMRYKTREGGESLEFEVTV